MKKIGWVKIKSKKKYIDIRQKNEEYNIVLVLLNGSTICLLEF